jgi:parallel beta-helix repeat protein
LYPNKYTNNTTGFLFFVLHDSLIMENWAGGNDEGIVLFGGQFGSDGNRLAGNVASGNAVSGIGVAFGANDNVVTGNVANDNRGPLGEGGGIWVVAATGNRLSANVTNRNLDNGIVVAEEEPGDTTGNSLKGNSASRNAGHGIDAVTGTTDAGGNRAAGNATPPQCVNVVCSK